MTNRAVPLPVVLPLERLLVQQLGPGFFHVIARHGYTEHVQQGDTFVQVCAPCLTTNQRHPYYSESDN